MKRGEWLRARREELKRLDPTRPSKFSVRAVASRIGITGGGLSNLEVSNTMPTIDIAVGLAREYGMPVEWVLTGVGSQLSTIPITGDTILGPSESGNTPPGENTHEFIDLPIGNRELFALKIVSSIDGYRMGDVLICAKDRLPELGEDVAVHYKKPDEKGFSFFIMKLSSERNGSLVLDSTSSKNERSFANMDDLNFIYPVVGVAKSITVNKL